MNQFGSKLFSGSRFLFWTLAPLLIGFAILMPLIVEIERVTEALVLYGMSITCLALVLGLANPIRFQWALRIVAFIVFLVYIGYLASMIVGYAQEKEELISKRSATSVLSAVFGLVIIGYPSLKYMLVGRFSWKEVVEAELADEYSEDYEN